MYEIGLIGNPNIGKTTLFNGLTGSNQKTGNWPGVTVGKKEGKYIHKDKSYRIIDLPGTYSLSANSEDERVAMDYIAEGHPDLVIDVVDATNLERNLYLATQIQEMGVKMVLALNMMDEASKIGLDFDLVNLAKDLGVPVVPITASKKKGLEELKNAISLALEEEQNPTKVDYGDENNLIDWLEDKFIQHHTGYPSRWLAIKYAEVDKNLILATRNFGTLSEDSDFQKKIDYLLEEKTSRQLDIIDKKYEHIHRIVLRNLSLPEFPRDSLSQRLDKITTNKYWGIPIFAATMLLVFQLTFFIGEDLLGGFIEGWIDSFQSWSAVKLAAAGVSPFISGFILDGLLAGVATILEFIPIILILFALLSFLEDVGYMARVAYVMDYWMRKFGLQGKSIISMIIGFGCNVPGVMATRMLDNRADRMIAILINPFMSCGAKIPVYAIFSAAFFPKQGGLVMFGLYTVGFILALIGAKILSSTVFKGQTSEFIMELPPYRKPIASNVLRTMWDNVVSFVKRATTIITLVIALLYLLANLPLSAQAYSQASVLGIIGRALAPIFSPMGSGNWEAAVAIISGIPAKEAVVASLGMLYAGASQEGQLVEAIRANFTPLSAVAYMVLTLLYTPCVAVLATVKKETGSIKWMLYMAVGTFIIAYVAAVLVYQLGLLLGFA